MALIKRINRKLYKITHPEWGSVLMLHRVTPERSNIEHNRRFEVTPEFLENLIASYRSKGYVFVSLDEVSCMLAKRKRPESKFVCITFDDGFRDNYEVAFPLLKKLNVPFAIYVATDFYEKKAKLWWYVLEDCVHDDNTLFNEMHHRLINLPPDEIVYVMEETFPQCGEVFVQMSEQLTLDASQIVELAAEPLCTIAAHSVSHAKLDTLSYDEQYNEIAGSKHKLEELINRPVCHFSYPFGAYNADSLRIVKELGFRTVAKAWGGCVRTDGKLMELFRVPIKQE